MPNGKPRKNNIILARIIDKSDSKVKIEIFSFGNEINKELIYKQINCDSANCWVDPFWWWEKVNN